VHQPYHVCASWHPLLCGNRLIAQLEATSLYMIGSVAMRYGPTAAHWPVNALVIPDESHFLSSLYYASFQMVNIVIQIWVARYVVQRLFGVDYFRHAWVTLHCHTMIRYISCIVAIVACAGVILDHCNVLKYFVAYDRPT
jgi:hypothetical protein